MSLKLNGSYDEGASDNEAGRVALFALAQTCSVPLCLRALIVLGVPRILCDAGLDAKLTAEEIARLIGGGAGKSADPRNLTRILRVLVTQDVVKEFNSASPDDPEVVETRYGATPALKYLREDQESDGCSLTQFIFLQTDPTLMQNLQYLHAPVLDNTSNPQVLAHGKELWEIVQTDPKFEVFHKGMTDFTRIWSSAMVEKYNGFEGLKVLVDVGGGQGANLATILSKYPDLRGINFDLPEVVAKGIQAQRLEHVGGNFFESVPSAGDAICMRWILHDWNDENCIKILNNVAKALPPHGKLIVMEAMMPETLTNPSTQTKAIVFLDACMMAGLVGARERTLREFRSLGAAAGFPKVEVVTTVDILSVIEFYKS